jgi:hypothetical protein
LKSRLTQQGGRVVTVSDANQLLLGCNRAFQGLFLNAEQQALVDLVKQSVTLRESEGGRLIELYRASLLSPTEDEFYPLKSAVAAAGSAIAKLSESELSEYPAHRPA